MTFHCTIPLTHLNLHNLYYLTLFYSTSLLLHLTAPGKQFSMETAPWKLTDEMVEVRTSTIYVHYNCDMPWSSSFWGEVFKMHHNPSDAFFSPFLLFPFLLFSFLFLFLFYECNLLHSSAPCLTYWSCNSDIKSVPVSLSSLPSVPCSSRQLHLSHPRPLPILSSSFFKGDGWAKVILFQRIQESVHADIYWDQKTLWSYHHSDGNYDAQEQLPRVQVTNSFFNFEIVLVNPSMHSFS